MFSYVLAPLTAATSAQIIKFFIRSNHTSFSWRNLLAYSGMPSSHAATVIALSTVIGLKEGFASSGFAIAITLAVLIIRDASGLRRQVGHQGTVLNKLTKELDRDDLLERKYPHLLERIGHTPAQLAVGSFIGLVIGVVFSWF